MVHHDPVSLDEIHAAHERIRDQVVRTPLVPLNNDAAPDVYLKLESLQPIGSFKLRGAANAIASTDPAELAEGVWTASAGNMAQGLAWQARRLGIPCTVVVPNNAPETKRAAIERLGGRIVSATVEAWFEVFETRHYDGMAGRFIHAFSDSTVMAGNGTIGVEIVEDLPDVDVVVVPWGGGGLACGIASALRALRPNVKIYAAEFAEMAPLAASWKANQPAEVPYVQTFIDGIGGPVVSPEMFELGARLLDGVVTIPVAEVASAVRLLAERNRVVAEGAGATGVAAALTEDVGTGKVACVVSGGNIDSAKLAMILRGEVP